MKIRKRIRLKEYNYCNEGLYFITICTKDMKYLFGSFVNNKMELNYNGIKLNNILLSLYADNYFIDYYQIMPNHLHLIIKINNDNKINLSSIVSRLKSKCTNLLKIGKYWQKGYYERVIRNQDEYENIIKYINENPFRGKYKW